MDVEDTVNHGQRRLDVKKGGGVVGGGSCNVPWTCEFTQSSVTQVVFVIMDKLVVTL